MFYIIIFQKRTATKKIVKKIKKSKLKFTATEGANQVTTNRSEPILTIVSYVFRA